MKLGKMGKIGYLKDYEKITHFSSKHDINVMLNHIWLLYNIGVESMFEKTDRKQYINKVKETL